ncbi:hypothetical protein HRbin10_02207 [bacterium HR10]|nr:hypothetical protein HRbin10_02207 [bacterium HR10]
MRKTAAMRSAVLVLGLLVAFGGWVRAKAQYVVSARAGLVNYTQGEVWLQTSSDTLARRLAPHHQLDDGDAVLTKSGRAEILLNPGSVLRLDRNTEVLFSRTDLPLVEFGVATGVVLLEAADLNREVILRGRTPHASFRIKKSGLYRIDVRADATRFLVRSGELELLAEGRIQKLKKGQQATVAPARVEVVKLPKLGPLDEFELWAKERAEVLVAANRSLTRRRDFGYSLMASLWVFDPLLGVYTFVPFGFDFASPWGRRLVYRCPYPTMWYWGPYRGGPDHGGSPGAMPSPTTPSERSRPSFRVGDGRLERGDVLAPGPALGGRGERPGPHRMPAPSAPVGGEVRPAPGPVKAPRHQ